MRYAGKYGRARNAAANIIRRHAFCMLKNQICKHTLGICKTRFFSTATIVTRTRLCVAYVYACITCLVLLNERFLANRLLFVAPLNVCRRFPNLFKCAEREGILLWSAQKQKWLYSSVPR
jgi:hypothetical protein